MADESSQIVRTSDDPVFVRNRQNGEMKEATEALSEIVKRMCLIVISLQKRALLIPWRWIVFPEKYRVYLD